MKKNHSKTTHKFYFGKHAVTQAIASIKPTDIIQIYSSDKVFLDALGSELPKSYLSNQELNKLFNQNIKHSGYALKAISDKNITLENFLQNHHNTQNINIVALDQVTDPHNVGAIIRSAVAFNFDAILITEDNSPTDNGVISKVSSGGIDLINIIRITNLATTLEKLKDSGFWIIGLDGNTNQTIDQAIKIDRKVVILGSEGSGMRRLTREKCDFIYKIPMSPKMESLNVSNAAAIAFYELNRK